MKLLLTIHRLRRDRYAYSLRAGADSAGHYESAFDSLETCLRDAGDSLGSYFPTVQMQYEGELVGACSTELMRRNPKGLAERCLAMLGRPN